MLFRSATVCGGGRYDGLVEQLGGPPTPAFGWALGMERLMLLLEAAASINPDGSAARLTASTRPDLYVVNRGEQAERVALVIAHQLRAAGLMVELDSSAATFSKQFKRAGRSRATWALVIGDDEAERGEGRLKRLQEATIQANPNPIDQLHRLDDVTGLVRLIRE